ncbi:tyrosine-type recombinase/integrase [Tenacibaculum mesophilum]|uniref:tyrosine-type recombinase/integrase n=1 Tax=Tenacibaculum mesophilum TaxID=104268 RepID=UPI0024920C0E|nr:tyrosine-type recombinase/integrase [Tenacibaculum mesophilum]
MATVNFQLKGTNTLKHIYAKLYYRDYTGNKHNYFKNIGKQTTSEDWKKITTKKRSSLTAENKNLKNILEDLEDSILENFNIDISNNTIIDKEWLQFQIDLFFKKVTKDRKISDLLIDNIQYYINTANVRPNGKGGIGLSKDRVNQFKNLKEIVSEFQVYRKVKYRIKDVDITFKLNFLTYLSEKKYKTSYQQKLLSNIKTVCNDARKNGIEVSLKLEDIKITDVKKEHIIYLNEEELEKIKNLKITNKALNNARKWILIGANVGQRGNDLVNLTEKNIIIKNGRKYFELKQKKGNKPVHIPFNSNVEEIINDGFPYRLNISGEKGLNKRFKEIGELAGINEITEGEIRNKETDNRWVCGKYPKYMLLRTHDLRRTFATNLYGKVPNASIRAVTGHSDDQTLLRYIGKSDIDMVNQIVDYYEKQELLEKKESKMTVLKNVVNQ